MDDIKSMHKFFDVKKIGFEKGLDFFIFLMAFLVSVSLLIEKLFFAFSVYGESLSFLDCILMCLSNAVVFVTLCFWVIFLIRSHSSVFLRTYVIFFGLFLYLLFRLIQSGEISTRQGVEFPLVEHLALMVFGHEVWKQIAFESFVKWHLVLIFFIPLFVKWKFSSLSSQQFFIFLLLFMTSFLSPTIHGVPASLAHNSLVHVVKTAWTPIEDPEVEEESSFKFSQGSAELLDDNHETFNVVLIILESTGANRLDVFGSADAVRGSTPFLSSFASKGIRFTDTQAVMTSTSKSLVSILCSVEPYFGLSSFNATLGIPADCLPKRLSKLGYQTAFFQSAHDFYERRDLLVKQMGFENFVAMETLPLEEKASAKSANIFGMEDEVLLKENQRWLSKVNNSQKPFLTTYLTLAQHFPYYSPNKNSSFAENASEKFHNDFVSSLIYIDGFVEKIVNQYKQVGLYEKTIFVVVGDHGESFGLHHPQRFHNNSMYREGLWVPFFIVNEKLIPEASENASIKSLLDVSPTLEALLGIKTSSQYRGISALSNTEDRTVFAACWYPKRCLTAVDDNYKFIYNFKDMPEELYDREADVFEENNLAKNNPELVKSYRRETLQWYANINAAYEDFYSNMNPDYRDDPSSYYQFPMGFVTGKQIVMDVSEK